MAVKTICVDKLSENMDLFRNLVSEIHAHQALYLCPGGIVKLHKIFEDASFVYLVMDLHEGGTLNELISTK